MPQAQKLIIAVLIFFALTAYTAMHVPLHSDDFHYMLKGLSFEAEMKSYTTWSGRVVSDMLSPFLLNSFSVKTIGIINSACLVSLIMMIAALPGILLKKTKLSWFSFSILFMLYWVSNPSIGETTFWIVGASNYLWNNFFMLAYLCYLAKINGDSPARILFTFTLGIIAGCSNENMAPIVVIISLVYAIYSFKSKRITSPIFGLLGSISGACILLLSPGSASRASTFTEWTSTPLAFKIIDFFINKLEHALSAYWFVYLLVLVLTVVRMRSDTEQKNDTSINLSIVFLALGFLSNVAFMFSPVMPDRSLNGGLVLTLISVSFLLASYDVDSRLRVLPKAIALLICIPLFILSYYLFTTSVIANYYQSKYRIDIIKKNKETGSTVVNIPSLYFTQTIKKSDTLNSADGKGPMAILNGVKDLTYTFPDFDYSRIRRSSYFEGDKVVIDGLYIQRIYFYRDNILSPYKLIVQFSKPLSSIGGNQVYMHINMKNGVSLGADIGNVSYKIDENNYAKSHLGFYSPDDVVSFTFGVYTLPDVKAISENTVKVSELNRVNVQGWK